MKLLHEEVTQAIIGAAFEVYGILGHGGGWFPSPLDSVRGQLENWRYRSGSCPEAERAAREVINLPTDRPLGKREILAVLT